MENSYTRWLELEEEKADQEKEEFTDLNKFAKKITQHVETIFVQFLINVLFMMHMKV